MLRQALDPILTPGEFGNPIVIRRSRHPHRRTSNATSLPPRRALKWERMGCWTPGRAAGQDALRDAGWQRRLARCRAIRRTWPTSPLPRAATDASLSARSFCHRGGIHHAPGRDGRHRIEVPFGGTWPDAEAFRLVLDEGSRRPVFTETATSRCFACICQKPKGSRCR